MKMYAVIACVTQLSTLFSLHSAWTVLDEQANSSCLNRDTRTGDFLTNEILSEQMQTEIQTQIFTRLDASSS